MEEMSAAEVQPSWVAEAAAKGMARWPPEECGPIPMRAEVAALSFATRAVIVDSGLSWCGLR